MERRRAGSRSPRGPPARRAAPSSTEPTHRRDASRTAHSSSSVAISSITNRAPLSPSSRSSTHTRATVHADVLVDQRQPEPGTVAAGASPGTAAAGEALEDRARVRIRATPGPRSSTAIWRWVTGSSSSSTIDHRDLRFAAAVGAGVVDEVGDDTGEPPAVAADQRDSARSDTWIGVDGQGADGHRLADELGGQQLLEVEPDRAGVEAGDLEQVLDETLEARRRRSTAGRARPGRAPGISSRRASITSTDAASVISGERSSWLTSEAKRASRSTRCCSASAMSLNDSVRIRRSGSSVDSSRGVEPTAGDRRRGLGGRRHRLHGAPSGEDTRAGHRAGWRSSAAKTSDSRTLDRVASASSRLKNSKYGADVRARPSRRRCSARRRRRRSGSPARRRR